MTEADHQKIVVAFLRQQGIFHFSVANEQLNSFVNREIAVKVARKLKTMGSVRGVSDMVVFCKDTLLFLELKTPTGRQSKEQKQFEKQVNKSKYAVYRVAYGHEDAISIIKGLL